MAVTGTYEGIEGLRDDSDVARYSHPNGGCLTFRKSQVEEKQPEQKKPFGRFATPHQRSSAQPSCS